MNPLIDRIRSRQSRKAVLGVALAAAILYPLSFRLFTLPHPAFDEAGTPCFWYSFRITSGVVFKDRDGIGVLVSKAHPANYFHYPDSTKASHFTQA